MLEYSPIRVKFPPITAPRTQYTVQKKIGKISKLFVLKGWMSIDFDAKKHLLNFCLKYIIYHFSVFNCRNQILRLQLNKGKKLKNHFVFFSYSAFLRFFQDFSHIWHRNSISIRYNWTILTAMSSWDTMLKHKKLFDNMFWYSALL